MMENIEEELGEHSRPDLLKARKQVLVFVTGEMDKYTN